MTDDLALDEQPHGGRFGPLGVLRDTIRERAPHVAADCVSGPDPDARPEDKPELYLRVSCCNDTRRIIWDADAAVFAWGSGPDKEHMIGTLDDVEPVADAIGRAFKSGT